MGTKKDIMEIIIWCCISAIFFLFLAGTMVTFKPFTIKFEKIYYALGWSLIIIGILLIQYDTMVAYRNKWDAKLKPMEDKAIENVKRSQEILDELETRKADKVTRDMLNVHHKKD